MNMPLWIVSVLYPTILEEVCFYNLKSIFDHCYQQNIHKQNVIAREIKQKHRQNQFVSWKLMRTDIQIQPLTRVLDGAMLIQCKPVHYGGYLLSFKWKTHHQINTPLLMLRKWTYTASSRDALEITSLFLAVCGYKMDNICYPRILQECHKSEYCPYHSIRSPGRNHIMKILWVLWIIVVNCSPFPTKTREFLPRHKPPIQM